MRENSLRYPTVLFDWGDTVMRDDPTSTVPMVEWQTIEVIEGIPGVLEYLSSSGRQLVLATSANISDEDQIRGALRRGGLRDYFSHIYCFKNTNLPKGEAFYSYILKDLDIPPRNALMVGDSFEKDVQAANAVGIFAIWFNATSEESRKSDLHVTAHTMQDVEVFFESFDGR